MRIICRTLEDAELLHQSIKNSSWGYYTELSNSLRNSPTRNPYEVESFTILGCLYVYSHPSLVDIDTNMHDRVRVIHITSGEKDLLSLLPINWRVYRDTILDFFIGQCMRRRHSRTLNMIVATDSSAVQSLPPDLRNFLEEYLAGLRSASTSSPRLRRTDTSRMALQYEYNFSRLVSSLDPTREGIAGSQDREPGSIRSPEPPESSWRNRIDMDLSEREDD